MEKRRCGCVQVSLSKQENAGMPLCLDKLSNLILATKAISMTTQPQRTANVDNGRSANKPTMRLPMLLSRAKSLNKIVSSNRFLVPFTQLDNTTRSASVIVKLFGLFGRHICKEASNAG